MFFFRLSMTFVVGGMQITTRRSQRFMAQVVPYMAQIDSFICHMRSGGMAQLTCSPT
jgi:hypothetical protein